MLRFARPLAVCALFVACAPERGAAYERGFAEAARAESAGRWQEAAALYDAAAAEARLPRDAAHARYLAALALSRAGETRAAMERLDAIAAARPPSEDSSTAALRAAEMRIDAGDESGYSGLEAILTNFSNSGAARPALRRLLRHEDETRGNASTIALLDRLERALGTTELGESLAYERARRLAALGQTEAARNAFVDVATRWPYPGGTLFDDALFRASELDEALGRHDAAIQDLERMLKEREVAHLSGSYQRPRYGPALMRIALLYRDKLGDKTRACAALRRLYTEFTTSPLRDEAAWLEAEMLRDEGKPSEACARLKALATDLPDSRYIPCATKLCPQVQRALGSQAPATCHAYIERAQPKKRGESGAAAD